MAILFLKSYKQSWVFLVLIQVTVLLRLCCYYLRKVDAGTSVVAPAPHTVLVTAGQLLAQG